MMTNFSLMQLSACVRALVAARRKQRKSGGKGKLNFSFRTFLGDLISLLQDSLTGSALTAIFVCVSQAPANAKTSKYSLEFGEVFSQLEIKKRPVRSESLAKLRKSASKALAESEAALGDGGMAKKSADKYTVLRQAQVRYGRQLQEVLGRFGGAAAQ